MFLKMNTQETFQLSASTAALVCSAASLAFWLLLNRFRIRKNLVILSQAVISGLIFLGSFSSMVLSIRPAIRRSKGDATATTHDITSGCILLLLVLNEYLSVYYTVRCRIIHLCAGALFAGALAILPLSLLLPEHHIPLLSLFMIICVLGVGFVYLQYFRFEARSRTEGLDWNPSRTYIRRVLRMTSIVTSMLLPVALCVTIVTCVEPHLWAQLTMFQIAVLNLRRAIVSVYCLRIQDGSRS
ncbi:hypothetical protein BJX66DRAFT_319798 [Aspergillus keveii]|uniref:Uncharacterized protein n=1 Tax=Aspergillus keveii TaxID=714993 RepID=A0ABR4FI80_9EURO